MKYAVQLYSLRVAAEKYGAEHILKMVSDAGYDGVEFAGFYGLSPKEVKTLLEKYRLTGISAHIRPESVEENLPYIEELNMKYVFIPWVGVEEFDDPEKYAALLAATKKAKALLDERGIVFGYHNHAHEYADGKDRFAKILGDVEGLKAEPDVFWLTVAGFEAAEKLKTFGDKLAAVHIKEAAAGDARSLPQPVVGTGVVDMPKVFEIAKSEGVEWAILEVEQYPVSEEEYLAKSLENMKKINA